METDTFIQLLHKDMNECLDRCETNHNMAIFLKANAFRKAISEKKATTGNVDEAIKKLEKDLKKK